MHSRKVAMFQLNPFQAIWSHFIPPGFPGVFRGYKMGTLAWNRLIYTRKPGLAKITYHMQNYKNPQFPANFVTFNEENFNGKLHLYCSEDSLILKLNLKFLWYSSFICGKTIFSFKIMRWLMWALFRFPLILENCQMVTVWSW